MGDLNKRIVSWVWNKVESIIKAQVPMAEMFRYAIDLRSIARSWLLKTEFSHYEEVPAQQANLLKARKSVLKQNNRKVVHLDYTFFAR